MTTSSCLSLEEKRLKLAQISSERLLSDRGKNSVKKPTHQAKEEIIHQASSVNHSLGDIVCQSVQKRHQISNLLSKYLGSRELPIVEGMLLGGNEQISSSDIKQKIRVSGVSHILSASGSNVSLFLILYSPHLWKKFGKIFTAFLSAIFIFFYLHVAGCSPPLVRATLAALIGLLGSVTFQQALQRYTIALTVGIMLLLNHHFLTNIGFQLSVAATIGIYIASKVHPKRREEHLDTSSLYIAKLNYQSSLLTAKIDSSLHKGKALTKLISMSCKEIVILTLAAQLATLPITLFYFHELSLIAVVSNAAVLWLVPVIVYAAVVTAAAATVQLIPIATISGVVTTYCTKFFLMLITLFGSVPYAQLTLSENKAKWTVFVSITIILIYLINLFRSKSRNYMVFLCQ